MSVGTPTDAALILWPEGDLTDANEGTGAAIEIEKGAADAELYIAFGSPTGTNETVNVTFEVSVDGGSTWEGPYFFGRQFIGTDTPPTGQARFVFSRPIFVNGPPPEDGSTYPPVDYQPVDTPLTRVRLITAVGGTSTPTFPDFQAWLNTSVEGRTAARVN
jgi:hypothetical protein